MTQHIIGLGNPGKEYEGTRHNAGRRAVERFRVSHGFPEWESEKKANALVSRGAADGKEAVLVLPETFMNKSGSAAKEIAKSQKGEVKSHIVVVHDDLDLPVGKIKIVYDRGSAGHKGVESIIRALGTKAFTRIRIGIASVTPSGKVKKPRGEDAVHAFVLKKPSGAEARKLEEGVLRTVRALEVIMKEGIEKAMGEYNV